MLTSVYNEIVLLVLLICSYRSYNVLMCTGWLPLACLPAHISKLYYKVWYAPIYLQGCPCFKYPLKEFLMSSNSLGLLSNIAVTRACTSVATVHTTTYVHWLVAPCVLTGAHKQLYYKVRYRMGLTNNSTRRL
jgi:hypothetical protein